jgi:hypothetical protein
MIIEVMIYETHQFPEVQTGIGIPYIKYSYKRLSKLITVSMRSSDVV